MSPKRAKMNKEYMEARAVFLKAHPYCQFFIQLYKLDESEVVRNCGWFKPKEPCDLLAHTINYNGFYQIPESNQIHHRRGRVGSLLTDPTFFLAVCDFSHRFIHDNTRLSYENGWMLPR